MKPPAGAPSPGPRAPTPGGESWLGKAIDPIDDPWYRFGRVLELVGRHVEIAPGSAWLDVGCQFGQFLKLVQDRYAVTAAGIDDFDPADAKAIGRRYLGVEIADPAAVFDGTWIYHRRRIDEAGFALQERFGVISALEVIEHMVDTDAFLEECRGHLREGGHLVISTPNINSLRNRVQVPLGKYPSGMEYRTVIHHVRLYNAAALVSHLGEFGFRLVAMAGVNFLPKVALRSRALRWLDRRLSDRLPTLCGNIVAIFVAGPGTQR